MWWIGTYLHFAFYEISVWASKIGLFANFRFNYRFLKIVVFLERPAIFTNNLILTQMKLVLHHVIYLKHIRGHPDTPP